LDYQDYQVKEFLITGKNYCRYFALNGKRESKPNIFIDFEKNKGIEEGKKEKRMQPLPRSINYNICITVNMFT